jgi:hypothetical protein
MIMSENYDGRLVFDTGIDNAGFIAGISELGKTAGIAFGAVTTAATACAGALIGITTAAVSGYSETEQLVGGVKTLFGTEEKSAADYAKSVGKSVDKIAGEYDKLMRAQKTVLDNADTAYKTAGLSANEYMQTVTSFSAALIASLDGDTEAAAAKANQAITDMSDNANKMGSDMESIQNAYQGFAKQNYTMLDNLKLGYGGTKTEMERLLADAEAISGIKYDISSYADVIDAINVIQTKMGITGTTAREASETIQGSLSSAKAAYQNLVSGVADSSKDVDKLVQNFTDSVKTVADNIIPVAELTIPRLIDGLSQVSKAAIEYLPGMLEETLPELQNGIAGLIQATVDILPSIIDTVLSQLPSLTDTILPDLIASTQVLLSSLCNAIITALPTVLDTSVQLLTGLANGIAEQAPVLVPAATECVIQLAEGLLGNVDVILDTALNLITGLQEGVIKAIPKLLEAAPTIIIQLAEAILKAAFTFLVDLPAQTLTVIADGMGDFDWFGTADTMIANLADAYNVAVDNCTDMFTAIGERIGALVDPGRNTPEVTVDYKQYAGKSKEELAAINEELKNSKQEYKAILDELNNSAYTYENLSEKSKEKLKEFISDADLNNPEYRLGEALDNKLNEIDQATAGLEETWRRINGWVEIDLIETYNNADSQLNIRGARYAEEGKAKLQEATVEAAAVLAETEAEMAEKWNEIDRLNQIGMLSDEEALAQRLAFVQKYYPEYNAESHKYYKQIYDDRKKITDEAEKQREKDQKEQDAKQKEQLKEQETTVKNGIDKILDTYDDAYNELLKKRDEYKRRLLAIGGSLFDVTTETDNDGNEKTTYTINNIDEQIRKMQEYHANIKKLKEDGASSGLLEEIGSLGADDGAEFAKKIAGMSGSERKKLIALYKERDRIAGEMADDLYADEAKSIYDTFNTSLESFKESAYDAGIMTAQEFSDGFNEELELQMSKLKGAAEFSQMVSSAEASTAAAAAAAGPNITRASYVIDNNVKVECTLDGEKVGEGVTHWQKKRERMGGN